MMNVLGGTTKDDKPAKQYEVMKIIAGTIHLSSLPTNFQGSMMLIADQRYSEEVAKRAISSNCIVRGSKDVIANVADAATRLLSYGIRSKPLFDGLKSLADYTIILEMVHVIRETRTVTVMEATWTLLLNDLNPVHSCVEGDDSVWLEHHVASTPKSGTFGSSCSDSAVTSPAPQQKLNRDDSASSVEGISVVVQLATVKLSGTSGEHNQMSDQGDDKKSRVSKKGSSSLRRISIGERGHHPRSRFAHLRDPLRHAYGQTTI